MALTILPNLHHVLRLYQMFSCNIKRVTVHDKVIVADGRNTQVGSFNFSRAADRSNSENVLVVWDDPSIAASYLKHWTSRWAQGTDWKQTY